MTPSWPSTILFTGLSASGKSTLGTLLTTTLQTQGRPVILLDGDAVRTGLCSDLGFSQDDRRENLRRVAHLARWLNTAGTTAICCNISPVAAVRQMAREIVQPFRFVEIYLNTPLDVCEERDPKGLYARARTGKIPNFTGVSAPYEAPRDPDLSLATQRLTPDECIEQILAMLGE